MHSRSTKNPLEKHPDHGNEKEMKLGENRKINRMTRGEMKAPQHARKWYSPNTYEMKALPRPTSREVEVVTAIDQPQPHMTDTIRPSYAATKGR